MLEKKIRSCRINHLKSFLIRFGTKTEIGLYETLYSPLLTLNFAPISPSSGDPKVIISPPIGNFVNRVLIVYAGIHRSAVKK